MTSRFQRVSDTLDAFLNEGRKPLEVERIQITDWSDRAPREALASWSYAFELRWSVPPFVVKVRVHLTCTEWPADEDSPTISVLRLAEVFQVGAVPHIQNRVEEPVVLDELAREGFTQFVIRQLKAASETLPSAYSRGTNSQP